MIPGIPRIVYSTDSQFNGKIDVYENRGHYRIAVGNTSQSLSPDAKYAQSGVWGRTVDLVAEERPDALRVLLLGLGGGTIPHLLSRKLPKVHLTAVEIDEKMVNIAKQFFNLDLLKNLKVIIADAFLVLSEPENFDIAERCFDVVIIDIYQGENFPETGKSGSFFANIKRLLKPGGLVVFNRIYLEHHQVSVNEFIGLIEQFFSEVKTRLVAGRSNSDNILIYGRS